MPAATHAGGRTTVHARSIVQTFDQLRQARPPQNRVLSVYLDTTWSRIAGQAYLLAYRDGCKQLRASLPADERDRFEAAVAQAERYLEAKFEAGAPGLALFASGESAYWYVIPLPAPPEEEVLWREQPELEPLQQVLDDYERIGMVLFDAERARVFTIYLGEIEEQRVLQDDVPRKQATGGEVGRAPTERSEVRYARHREDHVRQHAQRTIRVLMELLRSHPFDRLFLAGPDEAMASLQHYLPRPLRARLASTLRLEWFATDAEVLAAALRAGEAAERQAELTMVDELLQAPISAHATLGVAGTVAALNAGRVHLLFVADEFGAEGSACLSCGQLVAGHHGCGACGGATEPVPDLREAVVRRALDQGARVEIVSGTAAARLLEHGGIGGWTRF